nr:APC family permease [Bacillus wiedmannii]
MNFVIIIGCLFILVGFSRFLGFEIDPFIVSLISLFAGLISLADLIGITPCKNLGVVVQGFAYTLFGILMFLWLLRIKINFSNVQELGDAGTIIGLGLVILFIGFKEKLEKSNLQEETVIETQLTGTKENEPAKELRYYKYQIVLDEYENMMKINDIIKNLRKIDQDSLPYNKVHNGWALLSDCLNEGWNPFFDGIHKEKYYIFLNELNSITTKLGHCADGYDYQKGDA